MADLRFVLVPHFGFMLLLQAVLFELLRVDRLVRALHVRRLSALLLGPAFISFALWPLAAVRAIAAISATATAAAIAAPTARFFAFLLRRTGLSILLALRSARLLGRTGRTLVRPALALRALDLGKLALLRHLSLLAFALRAIRPGLLLLRALIAALRLVAALVIAPAFAAASVALVITPAFAAAPVALVIAPAIAASVAAATPITSATLAAPLFVAVAMLIARAFRPGRARGRLDGRLWLFCRFLGLEPTEQAAQET